MQNQYNSEISDSTYLLLVYESIKYILSKHIDKKKQREEIEELGKQLGGKVTNHLLNNEQLNLKTKNDENEEDYFLKFIVNKVWYFIFTNNNIQFEKQKDSSNYFIKCGDIKLFSFLVTERQDLHNEKLDAVLTFICGTLKGAANAFNIECNITPSAMNYSPQAGKDLDKTQYILNFELSILNYNNAQKVMDQGKQSYKRV